MTFQVPNIPPQGTALVTDLYQLTMLQGYWREGMDGEATFSLFARSLPRARNFLLACGLEDALHYLETLCFSPQDLDYLSTLPGFSRDFLDWLADFRFTGDVRAMPEGTPAFAQEPLLEVTAPLPQAQLVETFIMNQVHFQTLAASKAVRVVEAAQGRPVVDFGLRRTHGTDAGLKGARAFYVAGVAATSHVMAGAVYGIPVAGTMAHSFIQAHDDEAKAFRSFAALYPGTILLVDTYDTLEGVRKVVALARKLGGDFRVRGVRLDSGNLATLAQEVREILDAGGLRDVEIFASGGLDEYRIAAMVASEAPVDGFGVGTRMSVSADAPSLDMAYKLTEYRGRGRLKLSPGKPVLPGRHQVFRHEESGVATGDVIAREGETFPGRPLLEPVMRGGRILPEALPSLAAIRASATRQVQALPEEARRLELAHTPYRVEVSQELLTYQESVTRALGG